MQGTVIRRRLTRHAAVAALVLVVATTPASAATLDTGTSSTEPDVNVAQPSSPGDLPSSFQWRSTGPLIAPHGSDLASVKDPSVVHAGGSWHVFVTTASTGGSYNMAYLNFTDWSQAGSAQQHRLSASGIGSGYRAAPQIFWFEPQQQWYLVYQTGNASYSTNDDISDPSGWSAPRHFYSEMPQIIRDNIGNGFWVDMWVICDDTDCHLFSSDDNGHLYRSQTTVAEFPNGFDEPVIALQDDRFDLFEASNVYRVGDTGEYLLVHEAIGANGRRYFRSWTSPDIAGSWTPLADTAANPFAAASNVTFEGAAWTVDISHGEMLRSRNDQTLTIDPCELQFLYQGLDPNAGGDYNRLPWRLGLLTQTNSSC
jgi:endo-1,4-beta-xylanase